MAFQREGRTSFPVEGVAREFKYEVSADDECLRIRIQDCVTRVQWQTELLTVADFTTMHSTIPQAGTDVYAQHISECLEPTAASPQTSRWLSSAVRDGSRELCIAFELQLLAFTTSLEYTFSMQVVTFNPVELVASRVNDLESNVKELICRNKRLRVDLRRMTKKLQKPQYQLIQEAGLTLLQYVRDHAESYDWAGSLTKIQGQAVSAAQIIYIQFLTMAYSVLHFASSLRAYKEVSPRPADTSSATTSKATRKAREPHVLLRVFRQPTIRASAVAGFCILWVFVSYRVIFSSVSLPVMISLTDARLVKDPAVDRRLRLSNAVLGISVLSVDAPRIERCHDVAALIHDGISATALSKIRPSDSTVTFSIDRKHPSIDSSHAAYVEMLAELNGKPTGLLTRTAKFLWTKWKKALAHG